MMLTRTAASRQVGVLCLTAASPGPAAREIQKKKLQLQVLLQLTTETRGLLDQRCRMAA
jgi:hypothetical protein